MELKHMEQSGYGGVLREYIKLDVRSSPLGPNLRSFSEELEPLGVFGRDDELVRVASNLALRRDRCGLGSSVG